MILPKEQMVAMLETPTTTRLRFTQFLASLSGTVKCLGRSIIIGEFEYNSKLIVVVLINY